MIVSHKHKFIYVKCKKVASTTTEIIFGDICGEEDILTPIGPEYEWKRKIKPRNFQKKKFRNHNTPRMIRWKLNSNLFDSYFKFMSVRNPWDRVVSFYWFRLAHRPDHYIKKFDEFVKWNDLTHWLPPFTNWIILNGKKVIDDFIRFENMEEDIGRIITKWVAPRDLKYEIPKTRAELRPEGKHYTEYYNDETRRIIAEKYAYDIEYLGYEFGDTQLSFDFS